MAQATEFPPATTVMAQSVADVIQDHTGVLILDEHVPALDDLLLSYLAEHDLLGSRPLDR